MKNSLFGHAQRLHSNLISNGYTHLRLCQTVTDDFSRPVNYHYIAFKAGNELDCFESGPGVPLESPLAAQIILNCLLPDSVLFYESDGIPFNTKTNRHE